MSRSGFRGPQLPRTLLDQVQDAGISKRKRGDLSRKDKRKAERQAKRSGRSQAFEPRRIGKPVRKDFPSREESDDDEEDDEVPPQPKKERLQHAKPAKSILKKPSKPPVSDDDEDEDEEEGDSPSDLEDSSVSKPLISRAVKDRLADDDAEIAALEKKLGLKGKKSKALEDDGLDWIAGGSDGGSDNEDQGSKRKRPADEEWLRAKRRKASGIEQQPEGVSDESEEDDMESIEDGLDVSDSDEDGEEEGLENPFSEDELDSDDFDGFDSAGSETEEVPQKRQRENPYVAPVAREVAAPTAKYIPPSLRKAAASDEEALKQLRRQLQGLLNRLSEANLLSILQSVEQVYEKNARQHVTSTLIDLLLGLVSDPSTLNDTFLILHAGFATALYKVIGNDFGAQLLEHVVNGIDKSRDVQSGENKQSLNLVAFLSNLYGLQLTGSTIVFDYIRIFLEELSESNTELLLRVIRTSGTQLRQDDPTSLKDIVLLLQRLVTEVGEVNLSVRTKFMIETINNLKNNRVKTGAVASALAAEHTTRMKKTLGSLNTRSIKATEPLRISLADIRDSEKKGKWWLVGASYHDPAKLANGESSRPKDKPDNDDPDAGYESETPGHVSLHKLARSQGMNTDIRRAIFISILSASDYKDAHMRLLKLHLKSKQELEIPRVLLHCAGAEQAYNAYYTLIARKLCSDRKIQKAFQFALWDLFRRMGESGDADDSEVEEDDSEQMTMKKIVNLAKLYGSLIADGGLSITVLKTLNFAYMQPKTATFTEVLLTFVMLQAQKDNSKKFDAAVQGIFAQAQGIPDMVKGLRYYIEITIANAEIANGKNERKAVRNGSEIAIQVLTSVTGTAQLHSKDDESAEDF